MKIQQNNMNNKLLSMVLVSMVLTVVALIMVVSDDIKMAFGDTNTAEATVATTTPNVADLTVLCSGPAVLDAVHVLSGGTGNMAFIDASSTTHTDFATSTAIKVWYPVGFGTTTNQFGIQFNRGIIIDTTTGVATSTVTYSCGA
jgi:hypothetical protein